MNSFAWIVYLGSILNGLGAFLSFVVGILLVGLILSLIIRLTTSEDRQAREELHPGIKRLWKICGPIAMVLLIVNILLPNTDTFYMMVGAHYGEEVITSEKVQDMSQKGLKILDKTMDQKLKELEGNDS